MEALAVPLIEANLGYAYARAGQRLEAARILERLRRWRFAPQATAMELALVCLGLGDKDAATAALEDAYRSRAPRMAAIADPFTRSSRMNHGTENSWLDWDASENFRL